MKILLTSLMSLASLGGGLVPVVSNLNNINNISTNQKEVFDSQTVLLGEKVQLITENSDKTWSVEFDWNSSSKIKAVSFGGGGLHSYLNWGGEIHERNLNDLSIIADGKARESIRDEYWSFLASAEVVVTMQLTFNGGNKYEFKIFSSTMAYNSGKTAWGNLTIGDSLTFSG